MDSVNVLEWVAQRKFSGPIRNKVLFSGNDFTVMVVCGPNARSDFHVNDSEEWFYQIKGALILEIFEHEHGISQVQVGEGFSYLLSANVPHRPMRLEGSIGIVLEKTRQRGQTDRLLWVCRGCCSIIDCSSFQCKDLEGSLQDAVSSARLLQNCPRCNLPVHCK